MITPLPHPRPRKFARCRIAPEEGWHRPLLLSLLRSRAPCTCQPACLRMSTRHALRNDEMPSCPLVILLCRPVVALPLVMLPPSHRPIAMANCRISSRHPLVAPPSCRLVAPAACCIAPCCPLVASPSQLLITPAGGYVASCCVALLSFRCATLLASHHACWLLSCSHRAALLSLSHCSGRSLHRLCPNSSSSSSSPPLLQQRRMCG